MADSEIPQYKATLEKLSSVSTSLCLAKWLQVTLHLHNGNTQSCHHVQTHKVNLKALETDPSGLHNTPEKAVSRQEMLTNKRPSECSYCWKIEDAGQYSDRIEKSSQMWAAPFFDEVLEKGAYAPINPRSLELSFDSVCNFKCMYCSPAFSTSWMDEIKRFGPYQTTPPFNSLETIAGEGKMPLDENEKQQYIDHFWRWLPDLSKNLIVLRVTGGEPLLSPETFKLMDWLAENPRPKMQFAINSNMGMRESVREKLIANINSLEKKINRFFIYTSLDTAHAKKSEYVRYGMNMDRFKHNLHEILSQAKWPIHLSYMTTVNALSLPGLEELFRFVSEQKKTFPQHIIKVHAHYLKHPEHLSIEILPPDFVKYIDQTLAFLNEVKGTTIGFSPSEIQKVEVIRDLILKNHSSQDSIKKQRKNFYTMIQQYDSRRNLNFLETFPEYKDFYLQCQSDMTVST